MPVIVLDLKTNKFIKFVSIAKAARALDTHSKTIWRKVQDNKLYFDRYEIIKYGGDMDYKYVKSYWHNLYYDLKPKDYKYVFRVIEKSSVYISYVVLIIIVCVILYIIAWISIDFYNIYTCNLQESRANHLKYVIEHRFTFNNTLSNPKLPVVVESISRFNGNNPWYFIWSAEWQFKYTHFYSNLSDVLSINSPILSNVNLNFSSVINNSLHEASNSLVLDNSVITSSPIISQANFNGISSVVSINPIINFEPIYHDYTNYLGIHGNRDYLTLITNDLVTGKSKELLNYQSNILYCLINGLSPSLY